MPVACSNSGIVFLSMYSAQFEIVRSPLGLPCALAVGWPVAPPPDLSMPPLLPQAASTTDAAQTPSAAARRRRLKTGLPGRGQTRREVRGGLRSLPDPRRALPAAPGARRRASPGTCAPRALVGSSERGEDLFQGLVPC